MGTSKITGLGDPTLAQDAATKNYIDVLFGSTTTAAASAAAAASSATASANSATASAASASAAATSASNAAASYDSFDDRYLGSKASDPSLDNDGNALLVGALYWNSTVGQIRVYNGTSWEAAYLPASSYLQLSGGTMTGFITFAAGQTIAGYLQTSGGALTGALTLNAQNQLRFADADSSHYVGFSAPGTVTSNKIWILPATDGTSGEALVTDGSGNLSWAAAGGGGSGVILESAQTISTSLTLTAAKNGFAVGPVTINTGVNVTVGTDQRWVIFG